MNKTLVTVGITAFDAVDSIKEAVSSAISQTWRPIEIVIVDDCSNDGTWELLQQLALDHNEIRLFRNNRNEGVAVSRNKILKEARGEFIAFFDDDDKSIPERITLQYRRIVTYERDFAREAPVVCYAARRVIYPDGNSQIHYPMGRQIGIEAPNGYAVAERILLGIYLKDGYGTCPTCSQMIRRDVLLKVEGFDPVFRRSEDTELNIRLAKIGTHFVGIPYPLVIQTWKLTPDKSLQQEQHYQRLMLDKHRDVADRRRMYTFCLSWIEIKQAWLEKKPASFFYKLLQVLTLYPWWTFRRLISAIPTIKVNMSCSRFYHKKYNSQVYKLFC
mgnify:CR=1 FL=1